MPMISRSDADSLIPVETAKEILQSMPQQSAIMGLARRLPDMTAAQRTQPILSALAQAYFVNGDTGLKQTTKMAWDKKSIYAEELAVIVPIPDNVLDDTEYDIWGEVKPRLIEAFGIAVDQAVLYGTNKPGTWPDGITVGAAAAGHVVNLGAGADLYDDVMVEGGVLSKVEEDGYLVTGHIAALTMKAKLRGLRDANGVPLFNSSVQEKTRYTLDGTDCLFPLNGAIDAAQSLLISGDWSQLVYAMRKDVTYKVLTEAVITDADGKVIYNLPQQDMVAIRAVMRLGWQLPNPLNRVNPNNATRYPFAVLAPKA
ncbi:MAG: phage major capsid protein [Clostridia bacterium]|nr:phage major capsid protein [Clostridia bacterium]